MGHHGGNRPRNRRESEQGASDSPPRGGDRAAGARDRSCTEHGPSPPSPRPLFGPRTRRAAAGQSSGQAQSRPGARSRPAPGTPVPQPSPPSDPGNLLSPGSRARAKAPHPSWPPPHRAARAPREAAPRGGERGARREGAARWSRHRRRRHRGTASGLCSRRRDRRRRVSPPPRPRVAVTRIARGGSSQ